MRLRSNPMRPVSQKLQPILQPTWLEMHRVARSPIGSSTLSHSSPSWSRNTAFAVTPLSLSSRCVRTTSGKVS